MAWVVGKRVLQAGGFNSYSPWEVALNGEGFAWVSDGGGKQIKKFRREGDLILLEQTISSPADAPFERPYSLAFDAKNRLLVSDERKPGLWVFERDGKFVGRIHEAESFFRLRRLGDEIFAVMGNGTLVLDAATHGVLRRIPTPGGFHAAMGFAVAPNGDFYFGAQSEELVRQLSPEGAAKSVLGPNYKAIQSLPETLNSGQSASLPLKIEPIAVAPTGVFAPQFYWLCSRPICPARPTSISPTPKAPRPTRPKPSGEKCCIKRSGKRSKLRKATAH